MASRNRVTAGLVALGIVAAACSDDSSVRVDTAAPLDPTVELATPGAPAVGTVPPVPTEAASPPPTSPEVPSQTTPADPPATAPSSAPRTTESPDTTPPVPTQPPATPPATEPPTTTPAEHELFVSIALDQVIDVGGSKPERRHDAFVAVALSDVERWWAEELPTVYGIAFEPLAGGVYAGYPERPSAIPGCAARQTAYEDLKLYVAFYCNIGDFIAYDDGADPDPLTGSLLTPLADQFGPAVVGVVLAHEYGHAIQERIGALDRPLATILTEQQADCFAGAWTGQAYRGESPMLRLGDADVRAGLLAMLEVRDPVGTDQFTPGGHGSAFDRVGAFQVGFTQGPARCAELLDEPLPLMPNAFRTVDDLDRGGNASYDCTDDPDPGCRPAPDFLADDVNNFWEVTLEGAWNPFTVEAVAAITPDVCADGVVLTGQVVVCPASRSIVYDEPRVRELYDEFGDFTLGYIYGIASAELAQRDLATGLAGEARALLNDCLTGAWVRDITPDASGQTPRNVDLDGDGEVESTVASSPGDLDEAIRMAILVGDLGADVDVVGSAFEKIDAFRTGVLGGLPSCADLTP